jgi:hypothetical protein
VLHRPDLRRARRERSQLQRNRTIFLNSESSGEDARTAGNPANPARYQTFIPGQSKARPVPELRGQSLNNRTFRPGHSKPAPFQWCRGRPVSGNPANPAKYRTFIPREREDIAFIAAAVHPRVPSALAILDHAHDQRPWWAAESPEQRVAPSARDARMNK